MGVIAKHYYRTVSLQSEWWRNFRLSVMVEKGSHCVICGLDNIGNDIHHMFYRGKLEDTKIEDVVVLCRTCHTAVHEKFDPKSFANLHSGRMAFAVAAKRVLNEYLGFRKRNTSREFHDAITEKRREQRRERRAAMMHCWCCGSGDIENCAFYNIFQFTKNFPVREHHFLFLCHDCGNYCWDHIEVIGATKQRQVFQQYEQISATRKKKRLTQRSRLSRLGLSLRKLGTGVIAVLAKKLPGSS